jgi:hypothetical protein
MRSLHYLTGRTPSPFPAEPEHAHVAASHTFSDFVTTDALSVFDENHCGQRVDAGASGSGYTHPREEPCHLDSAIGGHLPADWKLESYIASITFCQLLTHSSGIKDYGNVSLDYAQLKKFFMQTGTTHRKSGQGKRGTGQSFRKSDENRPVPVLRIAVYRTLFVRQTIWRTHS